MPVCARVQPCFLRGSAGRGPCFPLPALSPSRRPRSVLIGVGWGEEGGGAARPGSETHPFYHRTQLSASPEDGWGARPPVPPVIRAAPSPSASRLQPAQPRPGRQRPWAGGPGLLWALEGKSMQLLSVRPSPAGPALPAPSSMPQADLAVRCAAPRGPVLGVPFLQPPCSSHKRY